MAPPMRRAVSIAALGSLTLLSAACNTVDRLWRISPFEGSVASDRVNLWPLAYHNGGETSVLWPLFDVDERGFALRPLVAKDGTGYSILWPLASFDTDAESGWAGPFYVGPVWWSSGDAGPSGGLFPLAMFGSTSYVGPAWWSGESYGLFPLFG